MAIAGQHHLPAVGQQGVEGVQELFLGGPLAGQEVQVVHQQGVALAELLAESAQLAQCMACTKRLVNSSAVTKQTRQSGMALAQPGVDAFQQVRLAGADRAVQHQRVGALARFFHDAQGRGMGHAVAGPTTKSLEPVPAAGPRGGFARHERGRGWTRPLLCAAAVVVSASFGPRTRCVALPESAVAAGPCTRLGPAGGLEQLRVDVEADLHGPAEHIGGGRTHGLGKGLLQPLLDKSGWARRPPAVPSSQVNFVLLLEPEIVAWLPDALGDGLPQAPPRLRDRWSSRIPPWRSRSV